MDGRSYDRWMSTTTHADPQDSHLPQRHLLHGGPGQHLAQHHSPPNEGQGEGCTQLSLEGLKAPRAPIRTCTVMYT